MPLFSVLLPTRNGGALLGESIESVLRQPEQSVELVIADNANTDATASVIAAVASDSRVKVIRHQTVQTVTDNWTSALEASTGDYIVVIGDDDCLLPSYFEVLRKQIESRSQPDCIVYNGLSYVFPGSVESNGGSYFASPHFAFDSTFEAGKEISPSLRRALVNDMFRFRVRYPLNIQLTLFSRRAMEQIPKPFFRPPFPDHFAVNSLLLKATTFVYVPDRLVVIGLSPKSFGHFAYGGEEDRGMAYLGSVSGFDSKLVGSELLNSMYAWLEVLQTEYPELASVKIDRAAYVRRQAAHWLLQYRHHSISLTELRRRVARLTPPDRRHLAGAVLDPYVWGRLGRAAAILRRDRARSQWANLKPLNGVSNISEFVAWVGRE